MRSVAHRSARASTFRAAALVVLLCALAVLLIWQVAPRAESGLPVGAHDFIAYWSAYDLSTDGGDPYSEPELREVQVAEHGRYAGGAQRYWNPPWTLLALAPVLALPFELSASVWLVVATLTAVALVLASWWLLFPTAGHAQSPLTIGICLLFVPLLESIRLGQLGPLIALLVVLGVFLLQRGNDPWAGALFGLTVVKPQAALVVLFVVGIHVLARRRWAVVGAAVAVACTLIVASAWLLPSAWRGWDLGQASPTHWQSATVASWVRTALQGASGDAPTWPLFAIPLLGLAAVVPFAVRRRHTLHLPALPALLCFSLLMAPYAWLSDAMLLLPVQVAVVGGVARRERLAPLLAIILVSVQALALFVRRSPGTGLHHQIVLPLGLLVVAVIWWSLQSPRTADLGSTTLAASR